MILNSWHDSTQAHCRGISFHPVVCLEVMNLSHLPAEYWTQVVQGEMMRSLTIVFPLQDIYSRVARLVAIQVEKDAQVGNKLAQGVQGMDVLPPHFTLLPPLLTTTCNRLPRTPFLKTLGAGLMDLGD